MNGKKYELNHTKSVRTNSVKYLGIIYQSDITFGKHNDYILN